MLEIIVLTVVGIGFFALIVWVNLYAMDDDTPDPGSVNTAEEPAVALAEDPGSDGSVDRAEGRSDV